MDTPMWKVILLGDEEYSEGHVVETLTRVIDDMEVVKAEKCFREAQLYGTAIATVVPQVS